MGGNNYYLPQDVMEEHILIQLPAKSLLRFRAVNKSWNSLITSTTFKLKHYSHRLKLHQPHLMISSGAEIWNLDNDSSNNLHRLLRRSPIDSMKDVSAGLIGLHRLIAISNGIILLCRCSLRIWNPATHVSVYVPGRRPHGGEGMSLLGFWFDPKRQEYMIIDGILRDPHHGSFRLYSSSSGCWKSFRANPRLVPKTRNNRHNSMDHVVHGWGKHNSGNYASRACIDGKCYWIANEKQSHRCPEVPVVIVFDFEAHVEEEKYHYCNVDIMTFPETINERLGDQGEDRTMNLIEHEGCLTLLVTYNFVDATNISADNYTTRICDVWVMMCGVKNDHYGGIMWEHKSSIHFDPMCYGLGRKIREPRALKRMLNGGLGLVFEVSDAKVSYPSNVKLILYDPSTETCEDIEIAPFNSGTRFDVIPYVESLFCITPKKLELNDSETTICSKQDDQGSRRTQDEDEDMRRKRGPNFPFVLKNIPGNLKKLFSRCR